MSALLKFLPFSGKLFSQESEVSQVLQQALSQSKHPHVILGKCHLLSFKREALPLEGQNERTYQSFQVPSTRTRQFSQQSFRPSQRFKYTESASSESSHKSFCSLQSQSQQPLPFCQTFRRREDSSRNRQGQSRSSHMRSHYSTTC